MNITKEGNDQSKMRDQSDLGIKRRGTERLPEERDPIAQGLDEEAYNLKHRKTKIIIAYQIDDKHLWRIGIIYQNPSAVVHQRIFSYPNGVTTKSATDKVDNLTVLQEIKIK